jgi:hypothetical protein
MAAVHDSVHMHIEIRYPRKSTAFFFASEKHQKSTAQFHHFLALSKPPKGEQMGTYWSAHTHSKFSVGDALPGVSEIVEKPKKDEIRVINITDNNNNSNSNKNSKNDAYKSSDDYLSNDDDDDEINEIKEVFKKEVKNEKEEEIKKKEEVVKKEVVKKEVVKKEVDKKEDDFKNFIKKFKNKKNGGGEGREEKKKEISKKENDIIINKKDDKNDKNNQKDKLIFNYDSSDEEY